MTWVSSPVLSLLGNGLWSAVTGVVRQRRRKVRVMFMHLSWERAQEGLEIFPFYNINWQTSPQSCLDSGPQR